MATNSLAFEALAATRRFHESEAMRRVKSSSNHKTVVLHKLRELIADIESRVMEAASRGESELVLGCITYAMTSNARHFMFPYETQKLFDEHLHKKHELVVTIRYGAELVVSW